MLTDIIRFHIDKQSLQPDYTNKAARLQSFKYWAGQIPSAELVDAGFYMIARPDVVRCYSCGVVIQNWKKGDSAIDVHCLYSPNCELVKACVQGLNELDGGMASQDMVCSMASSHTSGYRDQKGRVKEGASTIQNTGLKKAQPAPQVVAYPHIGVGTDYLSQPSIFTNDHLGKNFSTNSSEDISDLTPLEEEIIFVSCCGLFM